MSYKISQELIDACFCTGMQLFLILMPRIRSISLFVLAALRLARLHVLTLGPSLLIHHMCMNFLPLIQPRVSFFCSASSCLRRCFFIVRWWTGSGSYPPEPWPCTGGEGDMNGRRGGSTGRSFVAQFSRELDKEQDMGESVDGMSGSRWAACREVTRPYTSDAARSGGKEQQKKEGRGRAARVVRVPERSGSVGKADWACSVRRLAGQRPVASSLGTSPDRLLRGQNYEVHTSRHKLGLMYHAIRSHGHGVSSDLLLFSLEYDELIVLGNALFLINESAIMAAYDFNRKKKNHNKNVYVYWLKNNISAPYWLTDKLTDWPTA